MLRIDRSDVEQREKAVFFCVNYSNLGNRILKYDKATNF